MGSATSVFANACGLLPLSRHTRLPRALGYGLNPTPYTQEWPLETVPPSAYVLRLAGWLRVLREREELYPLLRERLTAFAAAHGTYWTGW